MNNPDKWTDKHPDILNLASGKIYDEKAIKNYPNILTFDQYGEKADSQDTSTETKVYLHLKFKELKGDIRFTEDVQQGDIVDEDYHFLKLEFDYARNNSESKTNTEVIDNKKYDFYKLMKAPKKKVLADTTTSEEKQKYIWFKKTIKDFQDFREFIMDNISNEEDSKDRLRGLYEIPDIYVDTKYINYLEDSRTTIGMKEINKIIGDKKKIRNKNMVFDENAQPVNKLGYPFVVFYKYIDYEGVPCEPFTKNKQKLILSNRVLPSHIVANQIHLQEVHLSIKKYTHIL